MPYDPQLLERARAVLAGTALVGTTRLAEKKMFGGVAFMLNGNMSCGLMADGGFMVRVAPDRSDEFTARPHARVMEQGGRTMRGFILVAPAGVASDEALADWIDQGLAYAATLKAK